MKLSTNPQNPSLHSLTTPIISPLNGFVTESQDLSDHPISRPERKGYRIRHKYNRSNFYHSPTESWREESRASVFDSVPNAQIIYDILSRKPKYQGKIDIVPA